MTEKTENVWIIVNHRLGSYYWSNAITKNSAIERHVTDTGIEWKQCRKHGDRAVKATLTYEL